MNKFIICIFLIFIPFSLTAETESTASAKKKPEFTENQLKQLEAAEVKYKDNPEMMKLINKVKEQSGLNDAAAQEPPAPAQPEPPAFEGSAEVADDAYRNRDYETAFKHYQALAAEGDVDASMKLGTMYQMGQGTDQDPAAAQAWYKKAAEAGDPRAEAFMRFNETKDMSEEDRERSNQVYDEISGKQGTAKQQPPSGSTADDGNAIKFSVIHSSTNTPQAGGGLYRPATAEKITPEKLSEADHHKPVTGVEHLKPEKFHRDQLN